MLLAVCFCDFGYFISLIVVMFWTPHEMCFGLFIEVALERKTGNQKTNRKEKHANKQTNKKKRKKPETPGVSKQQGRSGVGGTTLIPYKE